MHLSGNLSVVASILLFCDKKGWGVTLTELENGTLQIFTPWKVWHVTRGGSVGTFIPDKS